MDNFERLTQSRGTLGAFLRSLPVLSGPWDDEFHRRRCAFCTRENCDECPNEEELLKMQALMLGMSDESPVRALPAQQ